MAAALRSTALVACLGAAQAQAADIDWTGLGVSADWRSFFIPAFQSPLTNWAVAGTLALPADGDTLHFGTAGNWATNHNDLTALDVAGIRFLAGADAFVLQGNGFTSSGDIVNDSAAAQRLDMPVTLGAAQTWRNAGTGSLLFTAAPVMGNHALTLDRVAVNAPEGAWSISAGNTVHALAGTQVRVLDTVVAEGAGSSGALDLDGTTTTWTTDLLHVGRGGTGALRIANGATLTNTLSPTSRVVGNAALGVEAGADGTVTVDGGRWFNQEFFGQDLPVVEPGDPGFVGLGDSGRIDVGLAGTGTLNVIGGGLVTVAALNVGRGAGSHGSVLVDGAGSVLKFVDGQTTNAPIGLDGSDVGFDIGVHGDGLLTVRNGGYAVHDLGRLGVFAGATGTAIIDAGELAIGSRLEVGLGGAGTLTVRNNGIVGTHELVVGPHGKVTLGTGGSLHADTLVLDGGTDTLELLDGTAVLDVPALRLQGDSAFGAPVGRTTTFGSIDVGAVAGSTARLTVRGADTKIIATDQLTMSSTNARVEVLDGGTLELLNAHMSGQARIANGGHVHVTGGIDGNVVVDGIGSTLDAEGGQGFNHATFSGGARVRTGNMSVVESTLAGDVSVTGAGTEWLDDTGTLFLKGSITVSDGARMVENGFTEFRAPTARLVAEGHGSRLEVRSLDGTPTLSQDTLVAVRDGATAAFGFIGASFSATMQIAVEGAGSRLDIGETQFFKHYSQRLFTFDGPQDDRPIGDTFSVTSGGTLYFDHDLVLNPLVGPLENRPGHETLLTVDGADSRLLFGANFEAQDYWPAHVTVRNGGRMEALGAGTHMLFSDRARLDLFGGTLAARALTLQGRITQDSAAVIAADRIDIDGGVLEGGTLDMDRIGLVHGHGTVLAGVKGGAGHAIEAAGGTLTLGADGDGGGIDFHGRLDAGSARIDFVAPSLVRLGTTTRVGTAGVLTSKADIAIDHGDLHLDGTLHAPHVWLNGGTLSGAGTLDGSLTVGQFEGTIVGPGNSPGTLHVTGGLDSGPLARYLIEIGSLDTFDVLAVDGDAHFDGGTLVFRLAPDFVPQLGDSFKWLEVQGLTSGLDTLQLIVETLDLAGDVHFVGDRFHIVDPRFAPGLRFALDGGMLVVQAVPLPGSLALFPFGLAVLMVRRRAPRGPHGRAAPTAAAVNMARPRG